jgi:hypothetical protein
MNNKLQFYQDLRIITFQNHKIHKSRKILITLNENIRFLKTIVT